MNLEFAAGAVLLSLLALVFVALPLRRGAAVSAGTRQAINKRVLQDQLADLDGQLAAGLIDSDAHVALRDELYEEAAAALSDDGGVNASTQRVTWAVLLPLLLCLVLGVYALYQRIGAQQEIKLASLTQALMVAETAPAREAAFAALVPALTQFLDTKPEHAQYRFLLAQAQTQQQDFAAAAANYQRLAASDAEGESAELLALYAQAAYLANKRALPAEAEAALTRALEINPTQRTALSLRGMIAFERQDYQLAVSTWQQLLATLSPASPQARTIEQALQNARKLLGPSNAASVEGKNAAPAAVEVQVMVDASDAARQAGATVFIYARAANGPRMPLAIERKSVNDLPLTVVLSDAQAMMPGMKLSAFDKVEILARISVSGSATTQPGDWQASAGVLEKAALATPVKLYIDTQVK